MFNERQGCTLASAKKRLTSNNHSVDALAYAQPVKRDLVSKIQMLVREGITSVKEVQSCLKVYVEDVMFVGATPPPDNCRAFYPTKQDISRHVSCAVRKNRLSELDQENVLELV